jgi:hypothetical protein
MNDGPEAARLLRRSGKEAIMTIRVNPENERTAVLDDAHVGDLSLGHG